MRRHRRLAPSLAALACVALGAAIAACSLGLDESLIGRAADDGGLPNRSDADAVPAEAGGVDGAASAAGACTTDADCTAADPCLRGRCETARGACVYDVCRPSACVSATCNPGAGCADPKPYVLQASKFDVGAPVVSRDVVSAVHPYVFLGTALGLVVFDASNPAAPPRPVAVTGLAFVPTSFAVSGRRLFLVGSAAGGTPSRLPLAWLDVPSQPGAASVAATSVLATYARGETPKVLERTPGTAFLVGPNASSFAATRIEAPFVEPLDLASVPTPFGGAYAFAGASGNRLVASSLQINDPKISVVDEAGVAGAKAVETPVTSGTLAPNGSFAPYHDGALAWSAASVTLAGPNSVRAVQVGFPLTSATSPVAPSPFVDVEVYAPPPGFGAEVLGPIAFVDANRVMVASAAAESVGQTSVKFVDRATVSLVKKTDGTADRRVVLPIAPQTLVGAAGSNGIGYLVANEAADPDAGLKATASVYVFDPACD